MKKILVTGLGDTRNNGCWSMLYSAIAQISRISPEPVEFVVLTRKTSRDRQRVLIRGVKLIVQPWTLISIPKARFVWSLACFCAMPVLAGVFKIIGKKRFSSPFWSHCFTCDLVLDLSGDSLSADYNNFSLAMSALPLLLARIINRPYMICAQSIGPFTTGFVQRIIVLLLKDAGAITTRERITDRLLSELNISENVIPAQDLAFVLEPAPQERIKQIFEIEGIDPGLPWVGMSISGLISQYAFKNLDAKARKGAYLKVMADFADFIVDRYDKNILFVPHVVIPNGNSDRVVTSQVQMRMMHKKRAVVLQGDYLGDELKGVIGLCDIFVGSRMHATIAAMSQGIPTLTYVYNHKTLGINGQILEQKKYLIDIRKIDGATLLEQSKRVMGALVENKEAISRQLTGLKDKIAPACVENAWIAVGLLELAGPLRKMENPLLCTGCGTCAVVCDVNAIELKLTPQGTLRPRLVAACTKCGKCLTVCPALGFDLAAHETARFGKKALDVETGVVLSSFQGYARDPFLREKGSSGGLVTAIAVHLLEHNMVDAVLVTGDDPENPFTPRPFWAENADQLRSARGSKYTPVPLMTAFKTIPDHVRQIAVVGLPCHLWGLELLEKSHFLEGRNIRFRLGLFCGRTPVSHGLSFLLKELKVDKKRIRRIRYRGGGWPGGMRVETDQGDICISLDQFWGLLGASYYHSRHCLLCPDFFSHLADISFGDAWLKRFRTDQTGRSVCLARSVSGLQYLKKLDQEGYLNLEPIPVEKIKQAMVGNIVKRYRQKQLKEHLFPESKVFLGSVHGKGLSMKGKIDLRLQLLLMQIGASRILAPALLNYPPNLLMRGIQKCQRTLSR